MQRTLESRGFISAILAMAAGTFLFYAHPFPDEQIFLHVIALRPPHAFLSFKYLYYVFLFTTPYLVCSAVLSGLYIFTLKARRTISPGRLPKYPDAGTRDELFLVVGEVHNPRKPVPAKAPYWLMIPERGLFTGIAILGAIGSGKTSCCMLPFAEQILAYKAADKEKRIGGLILEVKGDFCRKVKDILERHKRAEDYIEISLDSEYCYNPLHNDLDAYALAYNIASLLNNLFGRGKEPFWQQAYTNLVKFIILLHKAAYDYVTFFRANCRGRRGHHAQRKVNPSTIGLMRSAPSPAATIPKSLFSASPTTVRKTRPIRSITHATPSKKHEPLSTRSGEMFNLSRKPQVIPPVRERGKGPTH